MSPGWPAAGCSAAPTSSSRTVVTANRSQTSAFAPPTMGNFELLCARCVEPVPTPARGKFDLIFRPQAADAEPGERSITPDETEIGYYEESGLSLEDVVREQVLLSLPSRTLCKEDCKGLCPRCGQNLNLATCNCTPPNRNRTPSGGMRLRAWPARSNPVSTESQAYRASNRRRKPYRSGRRPIEREQQCRIRNAATPSNAPPNAAATISSLRSAPRSAPTVTSASCPTASARSADSTRAEKSSP